MDPTTDAFAVVRAAIVVAPAVTAVEIWIAVFVEPWRPAAAVAEVVAIGTLLPLRPSALCTWNQSLCREGRHPTAATTKRKNTQAIEGAQRTPFDAEYR